VRRYYAPVAALLATAHEDGLIASAPRVRIATPRRTERTVPKHLTGEQTAQLLAQIPAEHADLVLLLARTGARISEALTATYGGIGRDADGKPLLAFARSKTPAGLEPIPLTPDAARMLTRRRAAAARSGDDDLIFPSAAGTAYERRNWTRRVFTPAAERAGVPWATPKMLRHGLATLMAEHGYEAHDIAKALRHADGGRTAQQFYMHPKVRALDFVDKAQGGATE
jgi:integrase